VKLAGESSLFGVRCVGGRNKIPKQSAADHELVPKRQFYLACVFLNNDEEG